MLNDMLKLFAHSSSQHRRAVNPQTFQVLRIDRNGIIDDVILRLLLTKKVHDHTTWEKVKKKVDIGIATLDLIGLYPTNHIIAQSTIRQ